MATAKLIGASIKRREDPRFLTGKGNYTDDLKLAGMTYAIFVRSPHANAKIVAIDTAKARQQPGVVAIFTGKDMVGVNSLPCGWLLPELKIPPHMPLASDAARCVGDPVAIVIGESLEAARDAAELVAVDWQVLPSVTNTEKAAGPGAVQIHEELTRREPANRDELQHIDGLQADATDLRPGGSRILTKARAQIVATEATINAFWPPVIDD